MGWLWDWALWLMWYGLLGGGWWGWWRAHRRASDLDRQLTRLAHAWRYASKD